jgi:hypothetical protein
MMVSGFDSAGTLSKSTTRGREFVARRASGSVKVRKSWLSAIVDAISVGTVSIRGAGRSDNVERNLRTMPRGAAWFAVLI